MNELEQAMRHPDVIKNQIKQNGGRETVVPYSPSNPPPYPVTSVLDAYPVGSIYMSVNATSPASLFGGTWEQIKDTFLLAAGTNYTAGATGGEATHTLTETEMPVHNGHVNNDVTGGNYKGYLSTSVMTSYGSSGRGWSTQAGNEIIPAGNNRGGNGAHNNMPPYLAVYVWKRTA